MVLAMVEKSTGIKAELRCKLDLNRLDTVAAYVAEVTRDAYPDPFGLFIDAADIMHEEARDACWQALRGKLR